MQKAKPYIISVLIALAVGGLSALLTMGNMDIYDQIIKPSFAPPGIVFPIVWAILYVLMGICRYAASLSVRKKETIIRSINIQRITSHTNAKRKALRLKKIMLQKKFKIS